MAAILTSIPSHRHISHHLTPKVARIGKVGKTL